MTLYFDKKVQFVESGVISTVISWHQTFLLLGVGAFSQDKGGFVSIFDDSGLPVESGEWPSYPTCQVTTLAWHPNRRLLIAGWEDGELRLWLEGVWSCLEGPHNSALTVLGFSDGGGRLFAADVSGSVSGWKTSTGAPLTAFFHQLGDMLTHVAFCKPKPSGDNLIRGLAKAAVAGDEGALDALAAWRPKTAPRAPGTNADNHSLYAAQESGCILYIDKTGACSEVLMAPGAVQFMTVITSGHLIMAWETGGALSLTRFSTGSGGSIETEAHVRIAAKPGRIMSLAGPSSVAVVANETVVRVWDSRTGDNEILPLEDNSPSRSDMFTSIGYNELNGILSCGTSQGRIFLWSRDPRHRWKLVSMANVKGTIKHIAWGSEAMLRPLMAVNCITGVLVLKEQPICWAFSRQIHILQKTSKELTVTASGDTSVFNTEIIVTAMALRGTTLVISDGRNVQVFSKSKEPKSEFSLIYSFQWQSDYIFLHDDVIVGVSGVHIEARSLSGKQLGLLASSEGEPIGISITDHYLCVSTIDGSIKIADISKKGLRALYSPKNCYQLIDDFGEIMHASVNCTGRYICMSVANAGLTPDASIYVWDAQLDAITNFPLIDTEGKASVPVAIVWDDVDPRFVAAHIRSVDRDQIKLFFITNGALEEYINWNTKEMPKDFMLCTLNSPFVVSLQDRTLKRMPICDFVDETTDAPAKRLLIDFLYYMTVGQLESAVISGGNILGGTNVAVWNILALSCVQRNRPEVGAVCLAKMGNVKGALAMRRALTDDNLTVECRTGILAIQLGLLEVAKGLFENAGRSELLFKLIAATDGGLQELATSKANGEAALMVKSSQHRLACSLYATGEIGNAVRAFELAGTDVPHVPRMLVATGQLHTLQKRVTSKNDPKLTQWWAHYLESIGDLDGALDAYSVSKDYGAQTRLLCHLGRERDARSLVDSHPISAYHLARHYEMQADGVEQAVKLYISCGAFAAAIRVANEAQSWNLVWRAGTAASAPEIIVHAAATLERAGDIDRAISLYQKAGKIHAAAALALRTGRSSALAALAEALPTGAEPRLAARLAQHLIKSGQRAQAAVLLASTGKYEEALDIVEEDGEGCELSEELSERLAPPAGSSTETSRIALLRRLADLLGARGMYHAAAKRLAQAGDEAGAMRWLVRSGDIERIVAFASVSRSKAARLAAAGVVRTSGAWKSRPTLARRVLAWYARAPAPRRAAAFLAECAKHEIDQYQNYDKAHGALSEALTHLTRSADPETGPELAIIQEQMSHVRRYLDVKNALDKGDAKNGMNEARAFLSDVESNVSGCAVRIEDILQLMIKHSFAVDNAAETKALQAKLQSLEIIQKNNAQSDDTGDEIPEVIDEDNNL